jgi:hypothetical protein
MPSEMRTREKEEECGAHQTFKERHLSFFWGVLEVILSSLRGGEKLHEANPTRATSLASLSSTCTLSHLRTD